MRRGAIWVERRTIKTKFGIRLAVGNIDITFRLSIGLLSENTNDKGIFRGHVFLDSFELINKLPSLIFDLDFVCEGCVVGIDEVEVIFLLN